jgi:tetratricopeptide (TPR) repeat protein
MEPNSALAHFWVASAYEAKGDFAQALDHFEKNDLLCGRDPATVSPEFETIRRAAKESGKRGYYRARLKQAMAHEDRMLIARYYALLDEKEQALEAMERIASEQPDVAILFKFDAGFYYASLRAEPRFVALLKKVGLEK